MKIYLVGGAIRDQLLGIPVKDKDWVVVGATPDEMLAKKFKQVGKDFPVFIHPKTGEEYALARTERKSGHGYTGFEFDTNPNVTLEEDLARRDLTINAIAQDEKGKLIDPFNGQEDIKNKKLRHVSDAFSEDPLRVLRIARFHAKFDDFVVAPETVDKIREIVESGELEHLTPERKWLEIYKTAEDLFSFFCFLDEHKAKDTLFPEIRSMSSYPPEDHEIILTPHDATKVEIISCSLYYWLLTPERIESFCQRLKVPNEYKSLTLLFSNCLNEYLNYSPDSAENYDALISLIKKIDIRKKERLRSFMKCAYDSCESEKHKVFFEELIKNINNFKLSDEDQKKQGLEIKRIIENAHKEIAKDAIRKYLNKSD
jgi:tRNA nucleotidyltransferase (CCA-adding enzyme)